MLKFISFKIGERKNHFSVNDKKIVKIGGQMSRGEEIEITQELINNLQKVLDDKISEIKE